MPKRRATLSRMNRIVKTALLWLLALALPVQGWAAATQISCAPTMHQPAQVSDSASHEMTHAQNHHVMHDDMSKTASTAADIQDDSSPTPAKLGVAKCSACAACHIGLTALPSFSDWPLPATDSMPVVIAPASPFVGHVPDGIKRPPRSALV
ncbi:hypothetical protein [Oxalicibacterium solurbis]|uniref:Uncharacterized protein n=1 Tax=Oxalicibacterium solurbis TaxID=69280 RepID=A0A8J3AWB4_9BURK|nr:hypothetical protein [Oxalicibacterium solurbis]GGI54759.1 hypothetical protein GCM10011430_19330 [Oxalicibacterium solurbis]